MAIISEEPVLSRLDRLDNMVMVETQVKGMLIKRLDLVEGRLLKLEEELEAEKKREENVEKEAQERNQTTCETMCQ
ncbi:hypothetical protein CRYUN_Cryun23aG0166100 [Craigia yunnanensis]